MAAQALIGRVTDVRPHPESDNLDVVTIAEHTNVANRPPNGEPRYKVGDCAVVLGERLILPEWLLKHLDMWDEVNGKGLLAGSKGNRTKARRIAGVMSEVALCKVGWRDEVSPVPENPGYYIHRTKLWLDGDCNDFGDGGSYLISVRKNPEKITPEGYNMAWSLGIEEYVPTA